MKIVGIILAAFLVIGVFSVNFPIQSIPLFVTNTGSGTTIFQPSYDLQFGNFTQPTMLVSMTRFYCNSSFNGSIIPTLQQNIFGWIVTITIQGDWNTNVGYLTVNVALIESNVGAYQTLVANLTAASTSFTIDAHYNSTNCKLQTYLIGWHNIASSKFASCSVVSAGNLTCTFLYDAATASFLTYSILIIDNQWYGLQCAGCSFGYINITNSYQYFAKPSVPVYRYFFGFRYVGAANEWISIQDLPQMFSLAANSYFFESSVAIVMLPPYDTATTPPTPPPTVQPEQKLSGGAIAGIVVGTLAGASLIGVGIYCWKKNKDIADIEDALPDDDASARTEVGMCLNCMHQPAAKLKPCGHQVLCRDCVANVMMMANECPMCGRAISGSVPINQDN